MLKKKLSTSLFAIITLFIAGFVSSCSSDNPSMGIPDDMCVDFATFVSSNDKGSVFTLQKNEDSDIVTLTAAVKVDTQKLKPGTRVIIQYVPADGQQPYQSGAITLFGITEIYNAEVAQEPLSTIESWAYNNLKMMSIARTGQYINVWAQIDIIRDPKRFVLVADEATLGNDYPELYLVFTADDGLSRTYQFYASFDIAKVWNLTTCKGVKVNYNEYGGRKSVTFNKTTLLPTDPEIPAE